MFSNFQRNFPRSGTFAWAALGWRPSSNAIWPSSIFLRGCWRGGQTADSPSCSSTSIGRRNFQSPLSKSFSPNLGQRPEAQVDTRSTDRELWGSWTLDSFCRTAHSMEFSSKPAHRCLLWRTSGVVAENFCETNNSISIGRVRTNKAEKHLRWIETSSIK